MICQKSIFRLEGVLPNFWQNQAWFDQNVCRWAILLLWLLSIQETTTFQKTERIIPSTKGTLRLNLGEADERNLKQSSNNINDDGNKAIFFRFLLYFAEYFTNVLYFAEYSRLYITELLWDRLYFAD